MLQIVIYKKLNFWEEYTPLSLCINILRCGKNFVPGRSGETCGYHWGKLRARGKVSWLKQTNSDSQNPNLELLNKQLTKP